MPIKDLQDNLTAEFAEIGQLRKGAPSVEKTTRDGRKYNSYGEELPWFRFTSDDPEVFEKFREFYGDEPRSINILLPFEAVDENLECWKEKWSAGALQHRCDGETMVRWLGSDGKYHSEPRPCDGDCKPVMRLKVIVPQLMRLAYVTVLSSSVHDIVNVTKQLRAIYAIRGDLRGIPLILRRVAREISTPRDNGKRARVTKYLLQIEAAPSFVELQLAEAQRSALGASYQPPQLSAPVEPEIDEESGELPSKFSPKLMAAAQELIELAHRCYVWSDEVAKQFDQLQSDEELKGFGVFLLNLIKEHIEDACGEDGIVLPDNFAQFRAPQIKQWLDELDAKMAKEQAVDERDVQQSQGQAFDVSEGVFKEVHPDTIPY